MEQSRRKIELLAPAGSYETLCAVVEAGCDAVYIGGTRFGARAYADNPAEDMLIRGIEYAHLRGVKVYMTVNTLLKNEELSELRLYLLPYYRAGLDAVIVQDFGVMTKIAEWFPKLEIHASTQMTVTHGRAAAILPPQVTRIVPARELTLAEIRELRRTTDRELEIFVHGALCYCYSGQCLFSSLVGGRSGNRGRCAQPCRKQYVYSEPGSVKESEKQYLLSPKDQCLLKGLGPLLDTGIESLKIEGRMKRTEYAAGVTYVYRKWLDRYESMSSEEYRDYCKDHEEELDEDVELLADLYNRGGFCNGYIYDTKGTSMMSTERPNHTGIRVGTARVLPVANSTGKVAVATYEETPGPEQVLEFRTDGNIVCGEITTPKDITRFDEQRPVALLKWNPKDGKMPGKLTIYRMKNEDVLGDIREAFSETKRDIPIIGEVIIRAGEPMKLIVTDEEERAHITVTGAVPEAAKSNPTTREQIQEKMKKTGGSGYCWQQLSTQLDDGLFVLVSQINELRREGIQAFEQAVLRTYERYDAMDELYDDVDATTEEENQAPGGNAGKPGFAIAVMTPEQTEAALRQPQLTDLLIDMEGQYEMCLNIVKAEQRFGAAMNISVLLLLPRVTKGANHERMMTDVKTLLEDGPANGVMVRTPDQLAEISEFRAFGAKRVDADSTLYTANDSSVRFLRANGITHGTVSAELKRSEISERLAAESWITVYERTPLMVSEQCVRRTAFGCQREAETISGHEYRAVWNGGVLRDEEGNDMPVQTVCRYCHSILYNAHITSLLTVLDEVRSKHPHGIRMNFTTETLQETERALKTATDAMTGMTVSEPEKTGQYTKGHWKRGVL